MDRLLPRVVEMSLWMFVGGSVELSVDMVIHFLYASYSHIGPQLVLRCRLEHCLECWGVNLTGSARTTKQTQTNLLDISKSFESDCNAVVDLFADPY